MFIDSRSAASRPAQLPVHWGTYFRGHWDDCHPSLANTANADETVQQALRERVPAEEWTALEQACQRLPLPPRRGLIRLSARPKPASVA